MRLLLIALCLTIAASSSAIAQTPTTGLPRTASVSLPPGFRPWQTPSTPTPPPPLAGGLWFPATGASATDLLFDTAIFNGVSVQTEAAIRPGRWPLVLLSHGSGGSWRSLSWLGAGLAQQGAVVVAVNHPGSTFGDYDMRRSLDHGSRVNDLTTVLNVILTDAAIGSYVDPLRVFVAGFSLGGWTALSIGGLRGDLNAYANYCAHSGHRHCRDIARAGIDLMQLDASAWNRSYRDPRVRAVAAIDPGLHQGLTAEQSTDMVGKVLLIGLGQGPDRLPDTDFSPRTSALLRILPEVRMEVLAPAFHFSALPLCKPAGPAILAADRDDPVCSDPPGTDRQALHKRITETIGSHFGLGLR